MKEFREWLNEEMDKNSNEYKEFFQKMLKKYNVKEPDELDDEEKKKFFDEIDRKWKAKDEE